MRHITSWRTWIFDLYDTLYKVQSIARPLLTSAVWIRNNMYVKSTRKVAFKWSFPLFESSKMIHALGGLAILIGSYPSKLCEKFEIYCEYSFLTWIERRIHLLQSWLITVTSYIPFQSVWPSLKCLSRTKVWSCLFPCRKKQPNEQHIWWVEENWVLR